MTPSWYDVLDVDPGADAEQIRARWRSEIADLDPSDRRFRLLSQAAEVLLDPERRADHDAVLAVEGESGGAGPGEAGLVVAESVELDGRLTGSRRRRSPGLAAARPAEGVAEAVAEARPAGGVADVRPAAAQDRPADAADAADAADDVRTGWSPPIWLLAALAVGTAAFVALAVWQLSMPDDAAVAADARAAQGAAEDAAVAVLSYDYRDLDASQQAASAYLTPAFRRDYAQLFAQIEANAETVKPVVTAEVVASGIDRVNAAGDRVSVLVFVNRPTTNAQLGAPVVYQDQATMQMELVDGDWLLDDLTTSPVTP